MKTKVKEQTQSKKNEGKAQSAEELAEALGIEEDTEKPAEQAQDGEAPKVVKAEVVAPDEGQEEEVPLEKILKHLPEKTANSIRKLPEEDQLDLAKDYFKLQHPQGLLPEFKAKLQEVLPKFVQDLAEEFMIDLTAKRVQVLFPTGSEPLADMIDPTQVKEGKRKGGFSGEWGQCTLTEADGKVIHHASPSSMAKALGLRITGHGDMVKVFKNATKAEGLDWEKNWVDGKTITVERGSTDNKADGIHVRVS